MSSVGKTKGLIGTPHWQDNNSLLRLPQWECIWEPGHTEGNSRYTKEGCVLQPLVPKISFCGQGVSREFDLGLFSPRDLLNQTETALLSCSSSVKPNWLRLHTFKTLSLKTFTFYLYGISWVVLLICVCRHVCHRSHMEESWVFTLTIHYLRLGSLSWFYVTYLI